MVAMIQMHRIMELVCHCDGESMVILTSSGEAPLTRLASK
ncbi:hypothetical protein M8C21_020838 [Ambrosia artemisiifolia]|uniref:Uncharacterized protein n=1 Tax=Ambrosia artemisiifolia TaxID=4212 RepID=A0AAD5C822_AMBAR|nr:hypothetical protein M8C21_020838 [Ambrosia artemisiifolia]